MLGTPPTPNPSMKEGQMMTESDREQKKDWEATASVVCGIAQSRAPPSELYEAHGRDWMKDRRMEERVGICERLGKGMNPTKEKGYGWWGSVPNFHCCFIYLGNLFSQLLLENNFNVTLVRAIIFILNVNR